MPKIIHAADLHLDSAFGGLGPEKARERRRESRDLVDRLAELAVREGAETVLLSGDLFDGERVYPETLERLRSALARMACPVLIAPGNHDPFTPRSPYQRLVWPENVHIFRHEQLRAVALPACAERTIWPWATSIRPAASSARAGLGGPIRAVRRAGALTSWGRRGCWWARWTRTARTSALCPCACGATTSSGRT